MTIIIKMSFKGRWFDTFWHSKYTYTSAAEVLKVWDGLCEIYTPGVDIRLVIGEGL